MSENIAFFGSFALDKGCQVGSKVKYMNGTKEGGKGVVVVTARDLYRTNAELDQKHTNVESEFLKIYIQPDDGSWIVCKNICECSFLNCE